MEHTRYRIVEVDPDHPAMQVAMPLVSAHNDDVRCVGTGFLVVPGIAMTAAHVAEDWATYFKQKYGYVPRDSITAVSALYLRGPELLRWRVERSVGCPGSDIAFLQMQRPGWWGEGNGKYQQRCARLNMNPPKVGECVRIFGFAESEIRDGILYLQPSECTARVSHVHLQSTQWGKPISHLELDGEIKGRMSGGPCFDSDWNVVGVASMGLGGLDEVAPHCRVALPWPGMGLRVDLFGTGESPVWDFFKEGAFQALNHHRVYVASTGIPYFSVIDPHELKPIYLPGNEPLVRAQLSYSEAEAIRALQGLKSNLNAARERPLSQPGILLALLRTFFIELDSALRLSLRLAALRLNLDHKSPVSWEQLRDLWLHREPTDAVIDRLQELSFDWQGVHLFEVRTFAEQARDGFLYLTTVQSTEGVISACQLHPCRWNGNQLSVPEDIESHLRKVKRFTQTVTSLAEPGSASSLSSAVNASPSK